MKKNEEDEASGYTRQAVHMFDGQRLNYVELLLPSSMSEEIDRWNLSAAQARDEAEEERIAKRRAAAADDETPMVTPGGKSKSAAAAAKKEQDLAAKKTRLKERYEADSNTPDRVQVYEYEEPLKLLNASSSTPDSEVHKRNDALFKTLEDKGCFRKVGNPDLPHRAVVENLAKLALAHPNFKDVIQLIAEQGALARVQDQPVSLPPVLLIGPPGVGKTHFAMALKRALGRVLFTHSMDSRHNSSSFLGSSTNWANTRPGFVFDLVVMGDHADPIILVDEIDKAGDRYHGEQDPLAPLHSLLEPLTNKRVTDISAGMQFDASHVCWIATANHLDRIPHSLLSRFQQFFIEQPSAREAIPMAQSISTAVVESLNLPAFHRPGKSIALALAHLPPRKQHQALRQAVAKAIANERDHLTLLDLPAWVHDEDQGGTSWLH